MSFIVIPAQAGIQPWGRDEAVLFVMAALVPAIHVVQLPANLELAGEPTTWMTGTSPVMTVGCVLDARDSQA
jgi:hypothetical protein